MLDLRVPAPWRIARSKLETPGDLESVIERMARQLPPPRAILVLMDADKACPKELGPRLLERATRTRPDIAIGVVLAKCEFETWLLASVESMCGRHGVRSDATAVQAPESIRGAKEALAHCLEPGRIYKPVPDQVALTELFDMQLARMRSDSFDKCWREIERLLRGVQAEQS